MSKTKIIYPVGGYAEGHYISKCTSCGEDFKGDKRAYQCEPCGINTLNKSHKLALEEIQKLKNTLRKITVNNDILKGIIE